MNRRKKIRAEYRGRIWIEVRPGRDFADRSMNLWVGELPNGKTCYLGAVWLNSIEEVVRSYMKKLRRLRNQYAEWV